MGHGLFPLRTHSLGERKTRNMPAWCSGNPQVAPQIQPGVWGGLPGRGDTVLSLKKEQESEGSPKQEGKEQDERVGR